MAQRWGSPEPKGGRWALQIIFTPGRKVRLGWGGYSLNWPWNSAAVTFILNERVRNRSSKWSGGGKIGCSGRLLKIKYLLWFGGSALISRLSFSKTKTLFQRKGGRSAPRICLSSTLSLSHSLPLPLAQDSLHLQNNPWRPRNSTQKHSWDETVLFSCDQGPHLPFVALAAQQIPQVAKPESPLPDHAVLTFFAEILIAGLDPKPSDWWPFLTSESCWNPEQPQLYLLLQFPFFIPAYQRPWFCCWSRDPGVSGKEP